MIDSVTLKISDFILYSDQHFSQLKYQQLKGQYGVYGKFWTQYTTYANYAKKEGKYFPQVNIMQHERKRKGGGGKYDKERYLLVQVSAPKLIYGVNIFDIDERFLPLFAQKLRQALLAIHVEVKEDAMLDAIVQRVDYSKVIRTSASYGTSTALIQELARYNIKQSSDYNHKTTHSGRESTYIKFYNSSQGLVIYDKFDELSVNGTTRLEQEIASAYQKGNMQHGALRIELSLQKKQTVDSVLRRHHKDKRRNFTLADVLKTDIAHTVLLDTFEKIYVKGFAGIVYLSQLKEKELLHEIRQHTDSYNQQAILYLLAHRVRDVGLKAAVNELQGQVSSSTIYRYKKSVEDILLNTAAKKDRVNVISYLHRKLQTFTPVMPKHLDTILGQRPT